MTNYSRSRMPSNRPIDVKVELTIQDIASLSVVKNSFTADIWFSSVWHDPRLAFDMYDRCRTNLSFDDSFEKKIFSPNVCLVNTRTAIVHASPKANVLLMLLKNGTVFLNYRMRIESSCEMSLKDYPMDYHSCSLDFESYSYNTATVNIGWMPKAITFDTLDLSLSDFTVVNSSSHSFVEYYKAGQWGRLRATLTFKRKYSVHILQMYLPTYISVFIAFFAFLIDVKSLPARIVVGVNSIISLTYQKGNILATLPKSSELKAIDIFMGTCEAFIFATLLELAFVAYQASFEDKKQLLEFDRMKAPITKFVKMTRLFGSLENPGDKWSYEEQTWIHSGYYYGSFISAFLVQPIITRLGAKVSIIVGVIICIVGTFIIPIQVYLFPSFYFTITIRFFMGFSQGLVIPGAASYVSKWFPIQEKSTAMAIFTSGNQIGIAISMIVTSTFCSLTLLGGWPLSFFLYGTLGVLFLFLWIPRASERPNDSSFITAIELAHIKGKNNKFRSATIPSKVPWAQLYLSPCVISICLCSFCQSFIMTSFTSYLPQYYQSVFNMDIRSNGIWSAIPFVVQMSTKFVCAWIADSLKERHVSASLITKIANSIASVGSAVCILFILWFSRERNILVLVFIVLTMGFQSAYTAGYATSLVSVAPTFTSTISAYAQIFAQLASSIAPTMIGFLTKNGAVEEWMLVFLILAIISLVTGLFFHIFGSANVQQWAISEHYSICELNRSDQPTDAHSPGETEAFIAKQV
uniref:MFS domain-containing protein n=1 Tax=Rhabditophanes sp. KR3021 TaxID=114890 RepID=A0AC35U062_9BILA